MRWVIREGALKVIMAHVKYRQAGGEDSVFENECELLQSAGIDIVPMLFSNDTLSDHSLADRIKLGVNSIWSLPAYRKFKALVRKFQPDIVHFHNTFPLLSPSVYSACFSQGVPIVQTLHNFRLVCPGALLFRDGEICEECLRSGVSRAVQFSCYRGSKLATATIVGMLNTNLLIGSFDKVSGFIALTDFAAEKIRSERVPRDRIFVKPNFLPNPPEPRYEIGDYILYVGRLSKEKGVMTLLEALKRLDAPVRLKVAGDGPEASKLKSICKINNLPVEFLGFLNKKALLRQIQGAAFLVMPSEWYEGFPIVLLEAYACGKAVVASKVGSLDELVVENETGRKFRPGDARGLSHVILELLHDSNLLMKMGKEARAVFEKKYSSAANLKALLGIYSALLTRSPSQTMIGGAGG